MTKEEFLLKYPKPKKCPMSIDEWCDSLGYCWAYATAIDEKAVWDEDTKCPCILFETKKE